MTGEPTGAEAEDLGDFRWLALALVALASRLAFDEDLDRQILPVLLQGNAEQLAQLFRAAGLQQLPIFVNEAGMICVRYGRYRLCFTLSLLEASE